MAISESWATGNPTPADFTNPSPTFCLMVAVHADHVHPGQCSACTVLLTDRRRQRGQFRMTLGAPLAEEQQDGGRCRRPRRRPAPAPCPSRSDGERRTRVPARLDAGGPVFLLVPMEVKSPTPECGGDHETDHQEDLAGLARRPGRGAGQPPGWPLRGPSCDGQPSECGWRSTRHRPWPRRDTVR